MATLFPILKDINICNLHFIENTNAYENFLFLKTSYEIFQLYHHELRGNMQNSTAGKVNYGKNALLIVIVYACKIAIIL